MIYLDSAASTHVAPEVMQAMQPYFTDIYANPGSVHTAGLDAAKAVQDAEVLIAMLKPIFGIADLGGFRPI